MSVKFTVTPRTQLIDKNGYPTRDLFRLLESLTGSLPVPLPSHLVAAVPSATLFEGSLIYVSNETGGATVAFSDGTNWRRVQDRAVIS